MASDRKLTDKLRACVSGNPFAGASWPLSLELTHLGVGDPEWAKADTLPPLRTLHQAKISIIDWTAPPKVFVAIPLPGTDDHGPPRYAIEDFGSDYGEENDEDDESTKWPLGNHTSEPKPEFNLAELDALLRDTH